MMQYRRLMVIALLACTIFLIAPLSAEGKKPDKPPKPPPDGGGAAEIILGPYLQNATDTRVVVMWKATSDADSLVEYGTSQNLGMTVDSLAPIPYNEDFIHQVMLTDLLPATEYYYKVKTGSAESAIFNFTTLPSPGDSVPIRFAVYSDTQKNKSSPNKHAEIVNDGIIGYINGTLGLDIVDDLELVLVAGDLVDKGYSEKDWDTFFQEMENLGRHVAYLTVTGNHEYDNYRYFTYMSLPENGSTGLEEHWYYVDLSNVRIIGIDSNKYYYDEPAQLSWLDGILLDAAQSPIIDVVFVQMHHPYLTELWLEGETPFSGEIVSRLEQFTADSGKPSFHFTGHTHGYSRGQSLDVAHSWVTVATAEGDIDYWGDYENADRAEIEMSLPEWGFMIIEVDDVGVHVQRISRGNDVIFRDNEVVDEFTILFNNALPAKPIAEATTQQGANEVLLDASAFSDPDPVNAISYCHDPGQFDGHIESHFQVTDVPGDYSAPLADRWIRFQSLYSPPGARGERDGYYSEVTCASDMTQAVIDGLPSNADLYWRVRYRDDSLGWSDWSDEAHFTLQ